MLIANHYIQNRANLSPHLKSLFWTVAKSWEDKSNVNLRNRISPIFFAADWIIKAEWEDNDAQSFF